MASQLTLQTKVKLPSGHQIPQLGYGVSAVLLCSLYPSALGAVYRNQLANMKLPACSCGRREKSPRLSSPGLVLEPHTRLADPLLALKMLPRASA